MSTTASTSSTHREAGPGRGGAWKVVALREVMVKLRDKAFILGTLSTLVLVIGGIALSSFLGSRTETKQVAVVDDAGAALATAVGTQEHAADSKKSVEVVRAADVSAGERILRDGKADAVLSRGSDGTWQLVFKSGGDEALTAAVTQTLTSQAMARTAQKAGTTMDAVLADSHVSTRALVGNEHRQTMGFILGAAFSVLFLMSAMTYGMQIAQSVVEEKQSRIVEILVAAIPVRQLLAGKVIGNTLLALAQMALLMAVGLAGASFTHVAAQIPSLAGAVGWYLLFFVAGFLALACIWAAAGSMCTRNEDLQQTSQPLIWILMLAYMAAFMARGTWRVGLSYVPIVSSILMPARIVDGTARWYDLVIALALNLAFAAVTVLVGERIYRQALLRTQGRLSYKDAFRLAR